LGCDAPRSKDKQRASTGSARPHASTTSAELLADSAFLAGKAELRATLERLRAQLGA
jgi:hypothetical protein